MSKEAGSSPSDNGNGHHRPEGLNPQSLGMLPVDAHESFGGELHPNGGRLFRGSDDQTQPLSQNNPELKRATRSDWGARIGHAVLWLHERWDGFIKWSDQWNTPKTD